MQLQGLRASEVLNQSMTMNRTHYQHFNEIATSGCVNEDTFEWLMLDVDYGIAGHFQLHCVLAMNRVQSTSGLPAILRR